MSKMSLPLCLIILVLAVSANCSKTEQLGIYEIKKGNFSVKVTNHGARIISVVLPDKNGKLGDVVLGYDTIEEYKKDTSSFGAIVGRVANRISGAKFTLDDKVYKLYPNDGNNTLHGGKIGYSHVAWTVKRHVKDGPSPYIILTYHSFDGEEGFPGTVLVTVKYAILSPNSLSVRMKAKPINKDTPINLAQHTYWNLGGHNSGDILSQKLQIFATQITPVDQYLIPTGKYAPVENTPYDFLQPRVIKGPIKDLTNGSTGYDINYVVDGYQGVSKMVPIAVVYDKKSGRTMRLSANMPGVQLYTANHLKNVKGKEGSVYQSHAALCLETQGFPDAVNQPNFPSVVIMPGLLYQHFMLYEFSIEKRNDAIFVAFSAN